MWHLTIYPLYDVPLDTDPRVPQLMFLIIVLHSRIAPYSTNKQTNKRCRQMSHTLMTCEDLEEAHVWLQQASGSETGMETAPALAADQPLRSYHRRRSAVHFLLGDSVARDAQLTSRFNGDLVVNRCRGGAT